MAGIFVSIVYRRFLFFFLDFVGEFGVDATLSPSLSIPSVGDNCLLAVNGVGRLEAAAGMDGVDGVAGDLDLAACNAAASC